MTKGSKDPCATFTPSANSAGELRADRFLGNPKVVESVENCWGGGTSSTSTALRAEYEFEYGGNERPGTPPAARQSLAPPVWSLVTGNWELATRLDRVSPHPATGDWHPCLKLES